MRGFLLLMIFVCADFQCSVSNESDRAKSITQEKGNKLPECRLRLNRNERNTEDVLIEESYKEEEADTISLENRYTPRKKAIKGNDDDKGTKNGDEDLYYVAGSPPPPKSGDEPKGPEVHDPDIGAPLPENKKKENNPTEPKSPPLPDELAPPKPEGGNILSSIVLLLDELDRLQLEVLIRYLNNKMKLVCVPVP